MKRHRALWLVPVAAFAMTFGVFSVRHPSSLNALIRSPKGVITVLGMGVGFVVVWVMLSRSPLRRATPVALGVVVLGFAVYADVPFERSSTQNRTLVAEDVVDAHDMAAATTLVAATPSIPTPTTRGAIRHSIGELRGINHSASGTVSVIESPSGDWVLRFENFSVQGVPAPVLYVAQGDDVRGPAGTNLGAFTATKGTTLDVALPQGVEPGLGWTALIWCERFDTPIANAIQHEA